MKRSSAPAAWRRGYGRIQLMRLKNVLIVVKDIEKSKKFYRDLFGLDCDP